MRIQLEPAYVLHGRAYRETSLLLEVFSRGHGRAGLVARGARSSRSKLRNLLQPFRPLLLSWNQRGELGTLTAAEQVASVPLPRGDGLFCGLYVNELMMRALHRSDPHESLFESYSHLLADLAGSRPAQPLLRIFERDLLEAMGFGMQLVAEHASGEAVAAGRHYRYVPGAGPVREKRSRDDLAGAGGAELTNVHPDHGIRVSGDALLALQSSRIDDEHLVELKRLMRAVLRFHLGDRPLVSQTLFR
ncbi:DNA repair protein RecO [Elongatibacter sediminis]|uniref:DNA repair protein RecO n=1 Tax=Elongatibacter sediminis TaxID=3119006 RepID=A0AAW9RAU0_9GAMM